MPTNLGMLVDHKKRIQKNFTHLISTCNVQVLLPLLISKGVFPKDVQTSFQNKSGTDLARQFFLDVQKRGPKAFESLVRALVETDQMNIAQLLDQNREFIRENHRVESGGGAEPFIMPSGYQEQVCEMHKQYPAYNISLNEEPLKVHVTKCIDFVHDNPAKNKAPVYYTRSKVRGVVKIININEIVRHNPREGSAHDVANLQDLFEQMGMTVSVSIDLNRQEVLSELNAFVKNEELKLADMAILVIMSHGGLTHSNEEFFRSTEGHPILNSDVERLFSNDNCKYMQGKPKLIIYQVCRGIGKDYGTQALRRTETDGVPCERIPTVSDMLIVNSTLRGQVAHRDVKLGAWFIQLLCHVFMKNAHNMHVEDMLKWTHNALKLQRSADNGSMQTSEYTNRSFNLCYLNPGIYMEDGKVCRY